MSENTDLSSVFSISETELRKELSSLLMQSKGHDADPSLSGIRAIEKDCGAEVLRNFIRKYARTIPERDGAGIPYDPEDRSNMDMAIQTRAYQIIRGMVDPL